MQRFARRRRTTDRFQPRLTAPMLEGWFAKESITLMAPDGQANVIASSEPLDGTFDSQRYALLQGELCRKEFPGYRELAFESARVFGGKDGYVRRFVWNPPDGVPVTQIQGFYAEPERGFTFTATTPSTQFERFEMQFRQLIEGLALDQ